MTSTGIAFNRAVQLLPFIDLFERRGGKTAAVLRAAGLEHFDLSDPTTLITGNALYRAIHEMAEALGEHTRIGDLVEHVSEDAKTSNETSDDNQRRGQPDLQDRFVAHSCPVGVRQVAGPKST